MEAGRVSLEGEVSLFPTTGRFLGLDGGGSRTRVALWSGADLLCRQEGPASNPSVLGTVASLDVMSALITQALAEHPGKTPDLIGVGLAGVGPPERGLRAEIEKGLSDRFSSPVGVWNDAEAGLAGATLGEAGVLLIGGTGSSALGFDGSDRVALMGGWGRSLRDAGSAYELFQRFSQLLLLAQEEGETSFEKGPRAILLGELGIRDTKELIALFARGPRPSEIEACGRILFQAAEGGDYLALELLEEAGEDLLELALRCEKSMGFDSELPLILHGGLLEREGPVRSSLQRGLESREASKLFVREPRADAEAGAALLQLDALGETPLRALRLAF
jgi:N-acetylglucosamine kinase-like BadF-type ATPase